MFISFEGIDFCGKSTQVELLKKYLVEKKKQVEIIREPGGTDISEKVREIFLFSASRAQLVREKIQPYLETGIYVISDRFHDSTVAYQGFGRGIDLETVQRINNLAIGGTIPDLTFILDIPVDVAEKRKRLKENQALDRIEVSDSGFYKRVREGYLKLAEKEKRFRVFDGTLGIEKIHSKVVNEIVLLEKKEYV